MIRSLAQMTRNVYLIRLASLALVLIFCSGSVHHRIHKNANVSISFKQEDSTFRGMSGLTSSNVTVYGAVIMSDYMGEMQAIVDESIARNTTPPHKALLGTHRRAKMMEVMSQLPFPVVEWPPVRVKQCPNDKRTHHGTAERGLALAHVQILMEFVYFDRDVSQVYDAPGGMSAGSVYIGNDYSAVSGKFVAVGPKKSNSAIPIASSTSSNTEIEENYYRSQGPGLYKNGIPFRDDDILVIFEDDVQIAVKDISTTLREELNDMKDIDVLFLGWCEGRTARPIPLCAHAYAITRKGAKQFLKHFEPCGHAYDWQLVIMIRNKWLTHRTARPFSYQNNYLPGFGNGATRGMFQQDKDLGSLNGH